jgi:hypothetical protein
MLGPCGECCLRSSTRVMNGQNHRKAARKRMSSGSSSDDPRPKIWRRSTGDESAQVVDFCLVGTCARCVEHFTNKANVLGNVRSAHLDYNKRHSESQNRTGVPSEPAASTVHTSSAATRGGGSFSCPIEDCSSQTFTRSDNSRRHVRPSVD